MSKAIIILLFIAAAGGVFWYTQRQQVAQVPGNNTSQPGEPKKGVTEISLLYSTEKQQWIEAATQAFAAQHPEISVQLTGRGSIEAGQGIVDGKEKPTLWSPADSLVLNLTASDWQTKNGSLLFAAEGSSDSPQPLVLTPLVFVVWEDRAQALMSAGNAHLTWGALHDALVSSKGWPAVGGKPEWGFVKLGHTDPTRSNSGLQALISMAYEFDKKSSHLEVKDLLDPKFQEWMSGIEKGVTKFETSTGTFMTDMVRFGPSKFDIAVVYESIAAGQLENAQGRWGNLHVYYPQVTLWSDHPIALLQAPWVSDAQAKAARSYVAFLRGKQMQERALGFGFRPADPSVPVKTQDPQNPFNKLAQYGIAVDIPPAGQPPESAVVRNLMTLWSRSIGTR
jgi:ABC-type molybdate transport system substrate-binding protein